MELYYEVVPDLVMQIKQLCTQTIRNWFWFFPVRLKTNRRKEADKGKNSFFHSGNYNSFECQLKPFSGPRSPFGILKHFGFKHGSWKTCNEFQEFSLTWPAAVQMRKDFNSHGFAMVRVIGNMAAIYDVMRSRLYYHNMDVSHLNPLERPSRL